MNKTKAMINILHTSFFGSNPNPALPMAVRKRSIDSAYKIHEDTKLKNIQIHPTIVQNSSIGRRIIAKITLQIMRTI